MSYHNPHPDARSVVVSFSMPARLGRLVRERTSELGLPLSRYVRVLIQADMAMDLVRRAHAAAEGVKAEQRRKKYGKRV